MFISRNVTLRNDSCNLCRNKTARQVFFFLYFINFFTSEVTAGRLRVIILTARQVARKAAEYNCAFKHVGPRVIIAGQSMISCVLLQCKEARSSFSGLWVEFLKLQSCIEDKRRSPSYHIIISTYSRLPITRTFKGN